MSGAQVADFVSWSEDLYSLNPVSVGRLTAALQRKLNVSLYVNLKFTRPKPETVRPISASKSYGASKKMSYGVTTFH